MKSLFWLFIFNACNYTCPAQEFFPNLESASNVAKGVLATSLANETYKDGDQQRLWQGYTFNYGISPTLSLSQTYSFSNHHGYYLPGGFIASSPSGELTTPGYVKGIPYPFTFENFIVEMKWKFLNEDGEKKHLRMALYGQIAGGNSPHTSSEPYLYGDNAGAAGGIIATVLKNRFAVSLAAGFIIPAHYIGYSDSVDIIYGNAITYSLSFGYLLLPLKYKDYKQFGINIYLEFLGEAYKAASVLKNDNLVNVSNAPSLGNGNYLEVRPAIQFIINCETRIDISAAGLITGSSYERSYPLLFLTVLHNFYL